MSDIKRELKRCPICGSLPRYWQWNHGAMVECWCIDHRIQCEGKTLEEADEAWERRADVEPVQRWIPVTERLPEEDKEVLISYRYKEGEGDTSHSEIDITSYGQMYFGGNKVGNNKHWRAPFEYFHSNYEVIAWMPLPEPYKAESEDKE